MGRYIIRRLLWVIFVLLLVTLITYLIFFKLPPGDPAVRFAGKQPTAASIAEVKKQFGLDKPFVIQYALFVKRFFGGDKDGWPGMGFSFNTRSALHPIITSRLVITAQLALGAALVWILLGIPIGVLSALRPRSLGDRIAMGFALFGVSAPVFWLGLIFLYLFASDIGRVHIFPGAGSYVGLTYEPVKWFESLILPWLVVAAGSAAIYARLIRGSLIETMGEDYIRTARAKGLRERTVVLRHGVRAAINPVVTVLGVDIGVLLGSSVLVETVFNIPGIGRLNYIAITHADFPIVQGTVLFAALVIIVANIIVDIAYAFLDPRVRY